VRYYVGLIEIDYALVYFQMIVRFLVILPGFLPLFLLVLSPSWLALPVFWLWVVLSVLILLYVVLPEKARGWMKARVVRTSANLRRKRTQ
jgi:hypothetical protein